MKSIRIKNLRSFKDTENIKIKPITAFVGRNSSGKSSLIRTFPLIKQSYKERTRGPLLWYGEYVDFGSFEESINRDATNKLMSYEFKFHLPKRTLLRRRIRRIINLENEISFYVKVTIASSDKEEYIKHQTIIFGGHKIDVDFSNDLKIKKLIVNETDYTNSVAKSCYWSTRGVTSIIRTRYYSPYYSSKKREYETPDEDLFTYLRTNISKRVSDDTIHTIIRQFILSDYKDMTENICQAGSYLSTWNKFINQNNKSQKTIKNIISYVILMNIEHLTELISYYISDYYANTYYIAPVRATAERYYRIQNLALDEVDHRGMNLAMFIRNMTNSEFKKFQSWTFKHFSFKPHITSKEGHMSIKITSLTNNKPINLADTGFGYSQLLPIITQLWVLAERTTRRNLSSFSPPCTYIIEQPELHLHPAMQSQVIDAFIAAVKLAYSNEIELNIIFETHSKTMIEALARAIDNNSISNNDIAIYVVDKHAETASIKKSTFDESGYLENWPFGFFEPGEEQ